VVPEMDCSLFQLFYKLFLQFHHHYDVNSIVTSEKGQKKEISNSSEHKSAKYRGKDSKKHLAKGISLSIIVTLFSTQLLCLKSSEIFKYANITRNVAEPTCIE
jgi:hypothetical protein